MISKLDIINTMLGTMGESPLNEIDEDHPFVSTGLNCIEQAVIELQVDAWWFNVEHVLLHPDDMSKYIYIPGDAIRCDPLDPSGTGINPVITVRERRLYDTVRNVYEFDKPIKCEIHRNVPFEDMPISAKVAVKWMAVMQFQAFYDAEARKTQLVSGYYQKAMIDLRRESIRNSSFNLLMKRDTSYKLGRINGWSNWRYR